MDSTSIISIGLVLDIIGVILLFLFGLPSKVKTEEGEPMEWDIAEEEEEKRKRRLRFYKIMSHIGLACLIIGFSLQLIGNHTGEASTPSNEQTPSLTERKVL